MLTTLVCTMFLTLGVDVGWKPIENGKSDVYVIQIPTEQGKWMIENKEHTTAGIPVGIREVRIQFGDEALAKLPLSPRPVPSRPVKRDEIKLNETPLSKPPYASAASGGIVTTSMNAPAKANSPPPSEPKKKPEPKEPGAEKKTSDEGAEAEQPSYLSTAIISWIISGALAALIVYMALIYLDLRQRYQALLDRTLLAGNVSDLTEPTPTPTVAPDPQPEPLPVTEPSQPEPSQPEPIQDDSTSEAVALSSTLVGSEVLSDEEEPVEEEEEEEEISETTESDPDRAYLDSADLDGMASLLKNTNQVIAQTPDEEEQEVEDPHEETDEPEEDEDEYEYEYEYEEDEEEEEDDKDDWGRR